MIKDQIKFWLALFAVVAIWIFLLTHMFKKNKAEKRTEKEYRIPLKYVPLETHADTDSIIRKKIDSLINAMPDNIIFEGDTICFDSLFFKDLP